MAQVRWSLFGAIVLAGGCATHGGITTAHGIGEGNIQGSVEPGVIAGVGDGGSIVYPALNFALRYGISDRVEIGGRLGSTSYEVIGKYVFTDGGADELAVSIAPSATFWFLSIGGTGGGFLNYQVPLLFGVPTGDNQLIVGPKLRHLTFFAGGDGASGTGSLIMAGGVFAYSLKAGDTFRLHPELAIDIPLVAGASASVDGDSTSGVSTSVGGLLIGVNVGLLFGGN